MIDLMSAIMTDVLDGIITPELANATSNAAGKMLKVVEMQYKYSTHSARREPLRLMGGREPS